MTLDSASAPAIVLINPNTSAGSSRMMLDVAAPLVPPGFALIGLRAANGVAMIVDEPALAVAALEVALLATALPVRAVAIVVAAFGDPGVEALRAATVVPVVGIGAASIAEASDSGRRFGIATTTPGLVRPIEAMVRRSAVAGTFTGVRVSTIDPLVLAADPAAQEQALAESVRACIERDGAEAVIIGGGPLSAAARALRQRHGAAIIEPVPAAFRAVARLLAAA